MTQPLNQYEAIELARLLADKTGKPVTVTHLGHVKGGSQIGQQPKAGQSYTIIHPLKS
jgi:hypothetical protein